MNYDVFISCKSEDYQYAEEIYNFLKESGITVFLASTELRRLGESEYRKAISSALKAAHHMIVFASKPEYIDAGWVYYEWDMFVNAKLKGFKPGNIVTILKDVDTKEINMDLWKYESLRFDDYKKSLVSYVETPESRQRLEQIKIAQKEEAEKQRQEQARIEKQLKIKRELVALAEDFKKKLTNLSVDIAKIKEKKRAIGNVNYECPVCSEINSIVNENCEKCGWPFSPIEGIEGAEYLNKDRKTLIEKFKALRAAKCDTAQIDDLNNQIASLQASLNEAEKEKKELLERNKSLADEINKLREEKSKSKKDDDTNASASTESKTTKSSNFKEFISWLKSLKKRYYVHLALLFWGAISLLLGLYMLISHFQWSGLVFSMACVLSMWGIIELLLANKSGFNILWLNSVTVVFGSVMIDDKLWILVIPYMFVVVILYWIHSYDKVSLLSLAKINSCTRKQTKKIVIINVVVLMISILPPYFYAFNSGLYDKSPWSVEAFISYSISALCGDYCDAEMLGNSYLPNGYYFEYQWFDLRHDVAKARWWFELVNCQEGLEACDKYEVSQMSYQIDKSDVVEDSVSCDYELMNYSCDSDSFADAG